MCIVIIIIIIVVAIIAVVLCILIISSVKRNVLLRFKFKKLIAILERYTVRKGIMNLEYQELSKVWNHITRRFDVF